MEKPKTSVLDMLLHKDATLAKSASVTLYPILVEVTNHIIGMSRRQATKKGLLLPPSMRTKGKSSGVLRKELVVRALLYYTKALAGYYKDDKIKYDPLVAEIALLIEDETVLLDLEKPVDIFE